MLNIDRLDRLMNVCVRERGQRGKKERTITHLPERSPMVLFAGAAILYGFVGLLVLRK